MTVEEMPAHSHGIHWHALAIGGNLQSAAGDGYNPANDVTDIAGRDLPHNNMQPYVAVYMFHRLK